MSDLKNLPQKISSSGLNYPVWAQKHLAVGVTADILMQIPYFSGKQLKNIKAPFILKTFPSSWHQTPCAKITNEEIFRDLCKIL